MGAAVMAAALGLAMADAAAAQEQAPQGAGPGGGGHGMVRQACAADVQTFCPGMRPGGEELRACMRQNAEKLSAGCKDALKAARAARQGQRPAS
jgi:hypothetical protein